MSIELVMPFNNLILCHPLLLPPSIFPSIRVPSNESALHSRWSKCFSFSISPSNEYSWLISFRIDWFDFLAVQGTLKILLQLHISKASIFQCSAFFIAQLSHPYMNTGKTKALTRRSYGKVMSLLFDTLSRFWSTKLAKWCLCFLTLSRFVIAFFPRSKHLLISWCSHHLQWFWSPPKIKSLTVSIVSPSICMKWWDQMPWS